MKIWPILLGAVAALGALVAAVKLSEASSPAKPPTKPDAKPATPPAAPAAPPAAVAPASPLAGLPVAHAPKAHAASSTTAPPVAPAPFVPPPGATATKGLETLGGPRPAGDLPPVSLVDGAGKSAASPPSDGTSPSAVGGALSDLADRIDKNVADKIRNIGN